MVKLLRYAELASGVDSDSGYFGLRPTRLRPRLRPKVGVENDAFSFENASFSIRFRLATTLPRSKTEAFVFGNGDI